MSKIYAQDQPIILSYSGSLAAKGTLTGSLISQGYARLLGVHIASASADSGSGLRVYQSSDYGVNWDYWADWAPSTCSGSAFSLEIVGNAVKVLYRTDSQSASVRTSWLLRPI